MVLSVRSFRNNAFSRFNQSLISKPQRYCFFIFLCLVPIVFFVIFYSSTSTRPNIAEEMSGTPGIPDKLWQPKFTVLDTSMGEVVIELYWRHAPNTCRNFAELCRRGYYNGTKFHRVIRDFMIQGGDPTGTGKGGSSIYGRTFSDEIHEDLKHTGAGIISMANSGPDTNGSQFFITLAPTQWLDGKHAIFGRVHSGMSVVKRIGLVETDKNDRPTDDVKIVRAYIRSN
ncbi:peptidyl-prolyl cis-trans isomerase-like 1 [Macrosteles quadrilineatus]|uniref:peptidyl-prolyl cis-trans isomerase-like 1 n=1 Tax=Macrosteles quadrilineatus TaxID=74068 RepID=UPI0023E216F4|nr:peptidyl-prolyl cis-trans isomerase-like 1 [Macrosteles quadrilineatus]